MTGNEFSRTSPRVGYVYTEQPDIGASLSTDATRSSSSKYRRIDDVHRESQTVTRETDISEFGPEDYLKYVDLDALSPLQPSTEANTDAQQKPSSDQLLYQKHSSQERNYKSAPVRVLLL